MLAVAVMVVSGCTCPSTGGPDTGMGGSDGSVGGGGGGGSAQNLPDGGMCVGAGEPCSDTTPCCGGTCAGSVCTSSTF
ncbi:MAG TPA: hypothetical protein VGD87_05965, partial [Archangium sp.]